VLASDAWDRVPVGTILRWRLAENRGSDRVVAPTVSLCRVEQFTGLDFLSTLDAETLMRAVTSEVCPRN
jgi:hypothetical protein